MPKSRKRKGHANKVKARNQKIEGKKNAFMEEFKAKLDNGVEKELETQARALKEAESEEIDGTEERSLIDTTMAASPIK